MKTFIVPIKPMEKMDFASSAPTQAAAGTPFQQFLEKSAEALKSATETAQEDNYHLAFGDVDDLARVQINAMKAESMIQTAVQLTTRAVNAYKEIMQMQI